MMGAGYERSSAPEFGAAGSDGECAAAGSAPASVRVSWVNEWAGVCAAAGSAPASVRVSWVNEWAGVCEVGASNAGSVPAWPPASADESGAGFGAAAVEEEANYIAKDDVDEAMLH